MNTYLLKRNNTYYFRRRTSKRYLPYFDNKIEIRIRLATKSKIHAMLISELVNEAYEEITMNIDKIPTEFTMLYNKGQSNVLELLNRKVADYIILHKIQDYNFEQKKHIINNFELFDKLNGFIQLIDPKNVVQNTNLNIEPEPKEKEKAHITIKELYKIFIEEKKQESDDDIAESTWRDYQSSYNDFIYVIKDAQNRDISSFTREDFRTYVDALHNHLPKNRTKLKRFKSLPYSKLKDIELSNDEKLAQNTKKKKMSTIKQIFDIALDDRYGYIDKNYAEAFLIKDTSKNKKHEEKKRHPLSDETLKKLFSSPIYTKNVEYVKKFNPEKYWIPIIAIYTGMRQNEICQLYIEDIKSEVISTGEKVYYFDINDDKDKHLKTFNSKRYVPIHPRLIELGFIDYFDSIKDKQDRLWMNLELHPRQKRYNTKYSKNTMLYIRRYVTKDKMETFHSMKHNVSTQLLINAVKYRIPKDLMNRLVAHKPAEDETSQTYFDGYDIESLYEGIKTLDYGNII